MEMVAWIVLMVVLIFIEILTVGLTTIWMAGGALAAFLIAMIPGSPIALQVGVFVAVSVLLMLFTRPAALRYVNSRTQKTNVDTLTGQTAVVREQIDNRNAEGRVMVNGMDWTARSADGSIIGEGTDVTILEVQGVTLIVRPVSGGSGA